MHDSNPPIAVGMYDIKFVPVFTGGGYLLNRFVVELSIEAGHDQVLLRLSVCVAV